MLDLFVQGKLTGYGIEEQLPTIAIVAHYDAYGVAPVSLEKLYSIALNALLQRYSLVLDKYSKNYLN